ncbi:hypothetical protein SRCM100623_00241 [Acetobacter pasteurianus]|uniref:TonB-dependent receptor plug domain-containing protein n=1 Tax=Acetobacter pasteurianus TaxID=438 RepID=A0A1A0DNJ0_ACEPA|nr:hypothetical protein SRCM100623_00241 [Acetobacter pasteurianus]
MKSKRAWHYATTTALAVSSVFWAENLAHAQSKPDAEHSPTAVRNTVTSQQKRKTITAVDAHSVEHVNIQGQRQANWVVTPVSASTIANYAPGTNALKALTTLPGVMYNSADPQGLNLWGQSFLTRKSHRRVVHRVRL